MNNTSKIIIATAAGAALGAVIGILFAPEKGSELRKKIADQGKKLAAGVREKCDETVQGWKEKIKDLA